MEQEQILSKILDKLIAVDEKIEGLKGDMDYRFTKVDNRLNIMENRISGIEENVDNIDKKLDSVFNQTARLTESNVELTADVAHLKVVK